MEQNKLRVHITGVTVNGPTYKNESFRPSMINFFFGGNGTGKSTLAKALTNGQAALTWDGAPFPDERVLVYNEDFIKNNVQSYGNIPGVFTISETNAEKKKEVDKKTADKKTTDESIRENTKKIEEINKKQEAADDQYLKDVWKKTEDIRRLYPSALTYLRDKKKFATKLETYEPKNVDLEEVGKLYDTVYASESVPTYQEYRMLSATMPSSDLISKPIISRSNTEFAKFVRALGNLDWVTQGHRKFHDKADGKCPYCQQLLPIDFSENLATCYDEQYIKEREEFSAFVSSYMDALISAGGNFSTNRQNSWVTPHDDEYKDKYELFAQKGKANLALLQQKEQNLADEIELEDLSPLIAEVNAVAEEINQEIKKHNEMANNIPAEKMKCSDMLWERLAYDCFGIISEYKQKSRSRITEKTVIAKENESLKDLSNTLNLEITKLNSETINTTKAMNDINAAIKSAGFKGFRLREKPGAKYVYELVRKVGDEYEVANQDLSEGERHFIAFCYFYHMVMGSQTDEGKIEDKIVIIDDPVSSMDSGILHMVASLTRQMIGICYNNYDMDEDNTDDHIRQIFCLTHNTVFFRDISFNRIPDYECVSFFEITKDANNESHIQECTEKSSATGEGLVNRSPVRNSYDALWHQYLTTNDSETLMIVIRQILDAYFIQMMGKNDGDLRKDLLDTNKKDFIHKNPDGTEDRHDYITAEAMVALLNVGATNYNDGLYYDPSSVDTTHLRSVFQKIFTALKQDQHFNMMTGKVS